MRIEPIGKIGVPHVTYLAAESEGEYCCKCKCMTNSHLSILSGRSFWRMCEVYGKDYQNERESIDSIGVYQTMIVDYLIANPDRHFMNWGFYVDNFSMHILKCHPLFDHNRAFDVGRMESSDGGGSVFCGDRISIKEAALYAVHRHPMKMKEVPCKQDFIDASHYEMFMGRAAELGIL